MVNPPPPAPPVSLRHKRHGRCPCFFSQLEAQVAESANRVSNGAAAASSLHPQSSYTAGDAEGGAARSLGEDGEEAVAVAPPAAEANGAEDLTEKVATMQAEVGVCAYS